MEPQGLPEDAADNRDAWAQYFAADEEWKDEHIYYGDGYGHRTEECWFTHILAEGDVEPEDILENIPDGTPISGPFEVAVHFEGSYDETEPNFILWKDKTHDDPS